MEYECGIRLECRAKLTHERVALQGGTNAAIALPPLKDDAVAYMAQNPVIPKEYAMATLERSVFVSRDAGKTWIQIANRGQGK